MPRPKTDRTSILIRLHPDERDRFAKKLIAVGFVYSREGEVEPAYTKFAKALLDKPLEWFQENFTEPLDNPE